MPNLLKLNEHLFKDSVAVEKLDWHQNKNYQTTVGNRLVVHVLRQAFKMLPKWPSREKFNVHYHSLRPFTFIPWESQV